MNAFQQVFSLKHRADVYGFWKSLGLMIYLILAQQFVFAGYYIGHFMQIEWLGFLIAAILSYLVIRLPLSYNSNYQAIYNNKPQVEKPLLTAILNVLTAYLISICWNIGGSRLLGLKLGSQGTSQNQQSITSFIGNNWSTLTILMMTIIVAPIIEEFCFRYLIIKPTKQEHNRIRLITSILLFSFLHVGEQLIQVFSGQLSLMTWLFYFGQYAVLGSVLAYTYNKHRSYSLNVMTHGIWNTLSMTIAILIP